MLRASRELRLADNRHRSPARIGLFNRVTFELVELALALLTRFIPDRCEEIVLMARRPVISSTPAWTAP
jgi:hypothetical protein